MVVLVDVRAIFQLHRQKLLSKDGHSSLLKTYLLLCKKNKICNNDIRNLLFCLVDDV